VNGTIQVFQHGKGTRAKWHFSQGKRTGTIRHAGAGHFLNRKFASTAEAKRYCETELLKDQNAIFYILENDTIVEIVLDSELQQTRQTTSEIRWNVVTVVIVAALSWFVFSKVAPFQSPAANLGLAGLAVLFYVTVLWVNNWNPVESLLIIMIMLGLASLLCVAVKKARLRRERSNHPTVSLVVHRHAYLSSSSIFVNRPCGP
jgi:hypothetical protein